VSVRLSVVTVVGTGVGAGEAAGAGVADVLKDGVAVGPPVQATAIIDIKAANETMNRYLGYICSSC
jgi:hypothetical protein